MISSVQIHSLFSKNSESLILGRLGANYSLRFSGPPRGVLPIGPNGIHGFGRLPAPPLISTLQPSPLSGAETNAAILSYNYTIRHQGLATNISCSYSTQSPIRFSAVPDTSSVKAQTYCNETGLAHIPRIPGSVFLTTDTNQTLTFGACKSLPTSEQGPVYHIYLRGRGKIYERNIGNITCVLSPAQPTIFPVTYQSSTHIFSTQDSSTQETITTSAPAIAFSLFIEQAISILGIEVQQAQTAGVNLLAESAKVLGIQAGFGPYEKNDKYLPLYGAMIQGILVDDVCPASNSSHPLLMVVP